MIHHFSGDALDALRVETLDNLTEVYGLLLMFSQGVEESGNSRKFSQGECGNVAPGSNFNYIVLLE